MKSPRYGCLLKLLELGSSLVAIVCWFLVPAILIWPLVFQALDGPPSRISFSFPADLDPEALELTAEGPAGTWSIRPTAAQVDAPVDSAWKGTLPFMLIFALMGFVATQLTRMFRSLRDGHPFIPENARRLRRIGQGVLAFEALRLTLTAWLLAPAFKTLEGEHVLRVGIGVDLGNVFVALCVLAFAEVFRRGTEMQAEQDLTV